MFGRYHLERYMANRAAIPINRWSMLNEMTFNLIAPLEQEGYHLPEELVPDISEGKMFCKWLRDEKKIDTTKLPTYRHIYADGRIVDAKLYPLSVLEDFREHFFNVWLPEKAVGYSVQIRTLPGIENRKLRHNSVKLFFSRATSHQTNDNFCPTSDKVRCTALTGQE